MFNDATIIEALVKLPQALAVFLALTGAKLVSRNNFFSNKCHAGIVFK